MLFRSVPPLGRNSGISTGARNVSRIAVLYTAGGRERFPETASSEFEDETFVEIEIVRQCHSVARYDVSDFMLDVAEERDVTDGWLTDGCELPARVEDPLVAAVTKEESTAPMGYWEDNGKRPKHFCRCAEYQRGA